MQDRRFQKKSERHMGHHIQNHGRVPRTFQNQKLEELQSQGQYNWDG